MKTRNEIQRKLEEETKALQKWNLDYERAEKENNKNMMELFWGNFSACQSRMTALEWVLK